MTRANTGLLGGAWLLLPLLCRGLVVAQPVTYDQRQEGKVNVQVDVKDLQIVALVGSDVLDDFSYDYAYDYADFTVKPSAKPTTAKPSTTARPILAESSSTSAFSLSSAALDWSTKKGPEEPLIKDTTVSTITKAPEEPTIKDSTVSQVTKAPEEPIIKDSAPTEVKIIESTATNSTAIAASIAEPTTRANFEVPPKRPQALGTAEPRKRCPVGFQMRSGRCFKRRHALLSTRQALMKLAPALLGKSQLFSKHFMTGSL